MGKSKLHGGLQILIIASGIVWTLSAATLVFFSVTNSQMGLEGLGLWLDKAGPWIPILNYSFISCGGLIVLYCLLYYLKWKKEGYVFNVPVLIFGVLTASPTLLVLFYTFAGGLIPNGPTQVLVVALVIIYAMSMLARVIFRQNRNQSIKDEGAFSALKNIASDNTL